MVGSPEEAALRSQNTIKTRKKGKTHDKQQTTGYRAQAMDN
jgi:hypothetical protein